MIKAQEVGDGGSFCIGVECMASVHTLLSNSVSRSSSISVGQENTSLLQRDNVRYTTTSVMCNSLPGRGANNGDNKTQTSPMTLGPSFRFYLSICETPFRAKLINNTLSVPLSLLLRFTQQPKPNSESSKETNCI